MVETPRAAKAAHRESNYVTVTVSWSRRAPWAILCPFWWHLFTFLTKAPPFTMPLCALGLSVNAHGSSYGTYVAAIGGLAEKEHGGTSGWMYLRQRHNAHDGV